MTLYSTLIQRYTTKEYDSSKKLSDETLQKLLLSLRYTPSSLNMQPWHYFIASDEKGRELIAQSTSGMHGYNVDRVLRASHVIVLCARSSLTPQYLSHVLRKEEDDGRVTTQEGAKKVQAARDAYIGLHEKIGDITSWNEKQVFIALGFLLFAAASLKIDATPIEGFDPEILSSKLHLQKQGLVPCVLVSLGYHAASDWNKDKPKSRLSDSELFTWIS